MSSSRVAFVYDNNNETFTPEDLRWLSQDTGPEIVYNSYGDRDKFYPIGINGKYAIGLNCSVAFKRNMYLVEHAQLIKYWKQRLVQCTYRVKYDYFWNKFLDIINKDITLNPVAEALIRDEELLKFRNTLPQEKPNDDDIIIEKEPVEAKGTKMELFPITTTTTMTTTTTNESARVVIFRYMTQKQWKDTNVCIPCRKGEVPGCCLYENYLLTAHYVTKDTIQVVLRDLNNNYKEVFSCEVQGFKGLLKCVMDDPYIVVSDGVCVAMINRDEPTYFRRFTIDGEVISATNVNATTGDIMIGTYSGLFYRIGIRGIIRYVEQISFNMAIINIENDGLIQTIASIFFGSTEIDLDRPICCVADQGKIIVQSKYGKLWMVPRFATKDVQAEFLLPEGVTYTLQQLTPWYHNGIYSNKNVIAILYPEGHIVLRQLSIKK